MINRTFHQLTVISDVPSMRGSHKYWHCLCSCGKETEVRNQNLFSGKTKSCGCYQKKIAAERFSSSVGEYNKKRSLPNKLGSIREIYRRYVENARKRNREFSIPEDVFNLLVRNPCHYCGIAPLSFQKQRKTPEAGLLYNGIDRVDNKIGYTVDNVVTCCKDCNYAKRSQTVEEFLSWAHRINKHQSRNIK